MQARAWLLLAIVLSGCAAPAAPGPVTPTVGSLEGIIVDALLRPVPGAAVAVGETRAEAGSDGSYRLLANWTLGEQIAIFTAPGHQSVTRAIVATTESQHFSFNITLAPTPVGRLDTQSYRGLISCAAIVQAGHSHGSGDPEEDRHIACEAAGRDERTFTLIPDADVQDLLLEVFWDANSEFSQRMTVVLRDEAGAVISFDEGTSPLRVYFGRGQIQNLFAAAPTATIQVLAGVSEDAPGDLFIGLHIEQPFQIFATTGHGIDVPAEFSVQGD